jgi:hypothetical protein
VKLLILATVGVLLVVISVLYYFHAARRQNEIDQEQAHLRDLADKQKAIDEKQRDNFRARQRKEQEVQKKLDEERANLKKLVAEGVNLGTGESGRRPIALAGSAVIWDVKGDAVSPAQARLPEDLRGGSTDPHLFLFLIVAETPVEVSTYRLDHRFFTGPVPLPKAESEHLLGFRIDPQVRVVSWADRKVLGTYTIHGDELPATLPWDSNNKQVLNDEKVLRIETAAGRFLVKQTLAGAYGIYPADGGYSGSLARWVVRTFQAQAQPTQPKP